MYYWLIVFSSGDQIIAKGDDLYDIHIQYNREIIAVIRLNTDVIENSNCQVTVK